MGGALQEYCPVHDFHQIFGLEHRRRHSSKGRKLVDHPANIPDMPNDRVRTDRKGFDVALDLLQVSASQSFGSQLDRRPRILDLVGNATANVAPPPLPSP